MPTQYDYDGRRFTRSDTPTAPIAQYIQEGNILRGSFAGADIVFGCLSGVVESDGSLHFTYSMVDRADTVIAGECRSTPDRDAEGRIVLREEWQRFTPAPSRGVSFLREIT